jgi:hypothetical protein
MAPTWSRSISASASKLAKGVIRKGGKAAKNALDEAAGKTPAPSPNPMTNLIIADLALRGGGQLLRHAVERTLLGAAYSKADAKNLVKGRTMAQTLIGTAVARIAMRSVPGAIVVGGSLLAKTLYDRRRGKGAAKADGAKAVAKQAEKGSQDG